MAGLHEKPRTMRIGEIGAGLTALLVLTYILVGVIGISNLDSSDDPIGDPWLFLMELCILILMPALLLLWASLRSASPFDTRPLADCALAFMLATAIVTMSVHFVLLSLGRTASFASGVWQTKVFAFEWPSVVYALDILAWDIFYPLAAFFVAFALAQSPATGRLRLALLASGSVAFAGLAGVVLSDMAIRNIGIIGYTVLLLPVCHFARSHFRYLGEGKQ